MAITDIAIASAITTAPSRRMDFLVFFNITQISFFDTIGILNLSAES